MSSKESLDMLLEAGVISQEEYNLELRKLQGQAQSSSAQDSTIQESNTGESIISEEETESPTGGELVAGHFDDPIPIDDYFDDSYLIQDVLGRGGTSIVYKIKDEWSDDGEGIFALKIFWPHLRTKPHLEQHFRSGHESIKGRLDQGFATIFEVGESSGIIYVRMEYVSGEPLSNKLTNRCTLEECLEWLKPLCEIIDRLHEKHGVAHCDIKPANIMLSQDKVVFIDFGIAQDISRGNVDVYPSLGTKETMAPEQYDGHQVGASSDRYALGLLVYRALACRYPWEKGESLQQIKIRKNTDKLIPLSDFVTELPSSVYTVIDKMLKVDPASRYKRCMDFYLALERASKGLSDKPKSDKDPIDRGGRVEPIELFVDPLHPLRKKSILQFEEKREKNALLYQQKRQRFEKLHPLIDTDSAARSEFFDIKRKYREWNLFPFARRPFGLGQENALIQMRLIPDGRFEMGSDSSSSVASTSEFPAYGVHISHGFWMAENPVTQELYEAVMGYLPPILRHPKHPVHCISWEDAIAFCNALSRIHNFEPAYDGTTWNREANGFRLPTEAEWEYCALAGGEHIYSGGDRSSKTAWCSHNSGNTAHPVRELTSNQWGLFDMSGNVQEWCWDYFGKYPTTTEKTLFHHDPQGPQKGEERVLRGGSYRSSESEVRCKSRAAERPDVEMEGIGFRIAFTHIF